MTGYTGYVSNLEIPDKLNGLTVTEIGSEAFMDATYLKTVSIPNTVMKINSYAFCNCNAIEAIIIPDGVEEISYACFSGCSSLVSVNIPSSVARINREAFYKCESLTSISLPEGLTSIGTSAFRECSSLRSVDIPESCKSFSNQDFWYLHSNSEITTSTWEAYWKLYKNDEIVSLGTSQIIPPGGWSEIQYTWDDDYNQVTASRYCLSNQLHEEVETVESYSYVSRQPSCIETQLNTYAASFRNNDFDRQVIVVDTGYSLGHNWENPEYIWSNDNTTVTAIHICMRNTNHVGQETVTTRQTVIQSPTENDPGTVMISSLPFKEEGFEVQSKEGTCPALGSLSVTYLPDMLTMIEEEAFEGLTSLEAVIVPSSCAHIGPCAFANCTNLVYVKIPANAIVDDSAFESWTAVDRK